MTPDKKFQIFLFGKAGCEKCKVLGKRLDTLLADAQWQDFGKTYWDVETEDGLVRFCTAESINPQRIPAFLVARWDESKGRYEPIPNANPRETASASRLYSCYGLQTDYSDDGKGLISPRMIAQVLEQAMAAP